MGLDVNIKLKAFKEKVFRAYDVRGLYPEELDHNTVELIAGGFAEFLKSKGDSSTSLETRKTCLLGRDIRWSSLEISEMVSDGLRARGIDVIDIGEATTPLHVFAIAQTKASGGIMVTASHNPIKYNGLKIYKGTEALSEKSGLSEIKEIIKKGIPQEVSQIGGYIQKSYLEEYVKFLLKGVSVKRKIKAVFDAGGGAVTLVLPKILEKLQNVEAEAIFMKPDPTLSEKEPNPLLPQAQEKIKEVVRDKKADIGFLFDPDGDRLIVFDENANAIRGDGILWLLARRLARAGESVVYDIRSSKALHEDLGKEGIRCFKSRVGHSFIKEEMRLEDAALGGELSGHFYFKDFFFSESSLFAMMKILEIVSSTEKKFSEVMGPYFRYLHSGEINLVSANKGEVVSALEKKYFDAERDYFDGVTFRYPGWWFNVRPSNTEDFLRLVLEAENKDLFNTKKDEVLSFTFSKGAKLA